jgi:hypothetical protein
LFCLVNLFRTLFTFVGLQVFLVSLVVLRTWANAQDSLRSYSLDLHSRRVSVLSAVAFFRHDFTSVHEVKV